MKIGTFQKFLVAVCLTAGVASAKFMPYPEPAVKYPAELGWESYLLKHWTYWKAKFNNNGGVITATKPDGTSANVSEAQSYGMLLSVWFNDKATFDQIYGATQSQFYQSGSKWYAWILNPRDNNYAGDADQDILGALIFASALVDKGYWTDGNPSYKAQAKILLASIGTNIVDGSNHRINSWPNAGDGIRNPSYHMPAWYQVFKEFGDSNNVSSTDWNAVRSASYALFNAQPNAQYGMARNFSSGSGTGASGGTSSPNKDDMGFDAIRVPYRIGMDAIWYPKHQEAITWCKNVWKNGKVIADQAGMYTISGPTLWGWGTANASAGPYADAEYEWALTMPMWGTAAVAVKDSSDPGAAAAAKNIAKLKNGVTGQNYFVLSANTDTTLKTSPNNNYYAQTLALLGALAMDGRAPNVWDDLKHIWIPPDTSTQLTTALTATPSTIAITASTTVRAKFNHPATVKLTFTGSTSTTVYTYSPAQSDSLNFSFSPGSNHPLGKTFTAGETIKVQMSGPWATPPANASTNITLSASNGVHERVGNGSVLSWTSSGLRIPGGILSEGDIVTVRVLDFSGRQQGEARSATAHVEGTELRLDVPAQHTARAGFIEVSNQTGASERYLLPLVR